VRTVHAPAWTTEWMSDAAREKLRAYGIAPPRHGSADAAGALVPLLRRTPGGALAGAVAAEPVPCPFCGSARTVLQSVFGSTACKALHRCEECRQPFEEFKPI
jgi:ring-1,2-phenylacetyl-CoA epoxidase subunit PaaD